MLFTLWQATGNRQVQMYLAGVSVLTAEDIAKALTRISHSLN
jgi:hypothetical protein